MIYIYSSNKLIAETKAPPQLKNGKRTKVSHLPYPFIRSCTVESSIEKQKKIGSNTKILWYAGYSIMQNKEQASYGCQDSL